MKLTPLSTLKTQGYAVIEGFNKEAINNKNLTKRLSEMGFSKGQNVTVANQTKDLFILKVGDSNPIALDKKIVSNINVVADDKFISSTTSSNKEKNIIKRILNFLKK